MSEQVPGKRGRSNPPFRIEGTALMSTQSGSVEDWPRKQQRSEQEGRKSAAGDEQGRKATGGRVQFSKDELLTKPPKPNAQEWQHITGRELFETERLPNYEYVPGRQRSAWRVDPTAVARQRGGSVWQRGKLPARKERRRRRRDRHGQRWNKRGGVLNEKDRGLKGTPDQHDGHGPEPEPSGKGWAGKGRVEEGEVRPKEWSVGQAHEQGEREEGCRRPLERIELSSDCEEWTEAGPRARSSDQHREEDATGRAIGPETGPRTESIAERRRTKGGVGEERGKGKREMRTYCTKAAATPEGVGKTRGGGEALVAGARRRGGEGCGCIETPGVTIAGTSLYGSRPHPRGGRALVCGTRRRWKASPEGSLSETMAGGGGSGRREGELEPKLS
ncbi:hypothetical protein DFH06DRAFT_1136702 [Mycena polygramma]|nr:hypothetical protein DFH06DRAFT_1136702 [Mycena polygramma]